MEPRRASVSKLTSCLLSWTVWATHLTHKCYVRWTASTFTTLMFSYRGAKVFYNVLAFRGYHFLFTSTVEYPKYYR